jgi:hypothetical protein
MRLMGPSRYAGKTSDDIERSSGTGRIAQETRYRFNDLYTKQVLDMRCASSYLFTYVN